MTAVTILMVVSVVMILLAIPLMKEKVPRNSFYGIRNLRSMTGSQEEWYRINRQGGTALFRGGLVALLISFGMLLFSKVGLSIKILTSSTLVAVIIWVYIASRRHRL